MTVTGLTMAVRPRGQCVFSQKILALITALVLLCPGIVRGVLDRSLLQRCELKGKHPLCDDKLSSFEQVLRQNLPFMYSDDTAIF